MKIKGCSCETRDFTCGFHFYEFLREQGLSKEDARDVTSFELYGEHPDLGRTTNRPEGRLSQRG